MRAYDRQETADLLPYRALARSIDAMLQAKKAGKAVAPTRMSLPFEDKGTLLIMPGSQGSLAIVKLVTVHPENYSVRRMPTIQGEVVVIDTDDGTRLGILDGIAVTVRRTAAGEAAASHGVYRPGGSALNAGQVGSMRAARYIAARRSSEPDSAGSFAQATVREAGRIIAMGDNSLLRKDNASQLLVEAQRDMSRAGAAMRDAAAINALAGESKARLERLERSAGCSLSTLAQFYKYRDALIGQYVYLCAMADYIDKGGKSRGSALYHDAAGEKPHSALDEMFRYAVDDGELGKLVQEAAYKDGACTFEWRPIRPLPQDDDFFENVWRGYRDNGNVY